MIFPCPASTTPVNLPPNEQIKTILDKQSGKIVIQYKLLFVIKSGGGVRPAEAEALKLVSDCTSVPVPELFLFTFSPNHGSIHISLFPGSPLVEKWDLMKLRRNLSVVKPGT